MNKRLPQLLMFVIFVSSLLASCRQPSERIDLGDTTDPTSPIPSPVPTTPPPPSKPDGKSVVRVIEGCSGQLSFNGKRFNFEFPTLGSGFFVDSNGYIVTAAHVTNITYDANRNSIEEACRRFILVRLLIQIRRESGRRLTREEIRSIVNNIRFGNIDNFSFVLVDGKRVPFDIKAFGVPLQKQKLRGKDVAVIKVNLTDTPILKLAEDSNQVEIQDEVTAIGYPGAADLQTDIDKLDSSPTFTKGIISSLKELRGFPVFQIDASIYGGNSGGPVINKENEVIGIAVGGKPGTNINYVIPSNIVREFVRQAGANNE